MRSLVLTLRRDAAAPYVIEPGCRIPEGSAADLSSAYKHCRRVCRHYGRTYYFSTQFFPAEFQPSVHALYAWVRYPDEWVDNPGELTLDEQRGHLRQWREATARAIDCGQAAHPVLAAWADTVRRHAIPASYLDAFLDAMELDLTVRRYETFDDLKRYTYGSASVVGLMMCRIVGANDPAAVPHAESLGLAMQLTNFLRDMGEDYCLRGRIYLPMEDLARFGVTEEDIRSNRITPAFRELVTWEAARARAIYTHADEGMHFIPAGARLPVRLARILYSRILDRIERNGCDVLTRRARVPDIEKLIVLIQTKLAHSA